MILKVSAFTLLIISILLLVDPSIGKPVNVFTAFSLQQVAEFKEAFFQMDRDNDGIINENDLRATFELDKSASDKELDVMLSEASGPINFTQFLSLFANRMAGSGATDDDTSQQ